MSHSQPQFQILITPESNHPPFEINNPRKLEIKAPFGAQPTHCWLELHMEDNPAQLPIGSAIEIKVNGTIEFKGNVTEKRIDSVDDQLSLVAVHDPAREWNKTISGTYEQFTVSGLLQNFVSGSGLTWQPQLLPSTVFSEITFSNDSIYFAVDLLAKVIGNWYWDISLDGELRFRANSILPDHTIFLHPDQYTVNIRENHHDVYSYITIECGIRNGFSYEKIVTVPNVSKSAEQLQTRIFVRPVSTPDVYAAFERSVIQHMTAPHYEHYVEWIGYGEEIKPGDTISFRVDEVALFPQDQIFRVKQRDITYSHGECKIRLHLTTGYESAPNYFYYFRNDRTPPVSFLVGRTGIFQLDISALDTPVHLDAA
jgi:signal peptidase I